MTSVLARVPLARLLRTPRGWLPICGWSILAIAVAFASRAHASGADHVLRGSFAFFVMPLLSFAIVSAALGAMGHRRANRGVVALGASPRDATLATTVVSISAAALACGLLAAIVCAAAHASHDPPLGRDIVTSTWIGGLGGAAYAAYFSFGAAIREGSMRTVFLAIDWIVGAGSGVGALFTPRGHVHALFGGPLCAELSQRSSSVALVLLTLLFVGLTLLLVRRT